MCPTSRLTINQTYSLSDLTGYEPSPQTTLSLFLYIDKNSLVMDSSEKPFNSKFVGNIPLLTNTNYHLWSPDIATHLQAIKALGIATGTENSPCPITPELYESYSLRKAKARGAIKGCCSESVKGYLSGVTTASEMWTVLKERLNSADSAKGRQAI
jgi:hypothetical protein